MIRLRLGSFGWLSPTNVTDIDANIGLHDSLAAMEWVEKYISKFGGWQGQGYCNGWECGSRDYLAHYHKLRRRRQEASISTGISIRLTFQCAIREIYLTLRYPFPEIGNRPIKRIPPPKNSVRWAERSIRGIQEERKLHDPEMPSRCAYRGALGSKPWPSRDGRKRGNRNCWPSGWWGLCPGYSYQTPQPGKVPSGAQRPNCE